MQQAAAEQEREQDEEAGTVRRCALTRARRPKEELIRFVLGPDGMVVPDLKEKLPGRGVWLTAAHDKRRRGRQAQRFRRALKTKPRCPKGLPTRSTGCWPKPRLSALALANKAGEVVFGSAKIEEAHRQGPGSRPDSREGSGGGRLPQARRQIPRNEG